MTSIRIAGTVGVVLVYVNFSANAFVCKPLFCSNTEIVQDVFPCPVLSNNIEK
jgi:hypothetical protein